MVVVGAFLAVLSVAGALGAAIEGPHEDQGSLFSDVPPSHPISTGLYVAAAVIGLLALLAFLAAFVTRGSRSS